MSGLERTELEKTVNILSDSHAWRIVSHVKPDGDTLGCGSALAQAGVKLGKDVAWCGSDDMPPLYRFLPLSERYEKIDSIPNDGRCLIYLDVSVFDRGVPGPFPEVNIDHHKDNELFGTVANIVRPEAAAAGEIMFEVINALGCGIDIPIAEALFAAIVTDCGWFKFSNATTNTLRVASELAALGVVPAKIDQLLDQNDSIAKVRLWGCCLSRIKRVGERAVLSWVTKEDFKSTEALESDTEGLVNRLTNVAGADLSVLVSETSSCLRCSVRARGDKSAQEFAARFGGGGHRYASGCKLYVPLEQGLAELESELLRA